MMQDTFNALWKTLDDQHNAIKYFKRDDLAFDEAKRKYQIAVEQKTAEYRFDKSYPVTLIPDLVRGFEPVANLRFERDRLHTLSETDRFLIRHFETRAWILQRQLEMEMKGR